MGQGTDSCGGYEEEFDPYSDGLETGMWTQRDGSRIHVDYMGLRHLWNARRLVLSKAACATFSSEKEMWQEWAEMFEQAVSRRREAPQPRSSFVRPAVPPPPKKPVRGAMVERRCHCGATYMARVADIKRGWAKSCSKRCASEKRLKRAPK